MIAVTVSMTARDSKVPLSRNFDTMSVAVAHTTVGNVSAAWPASNLILIDLMMTISPNTYSADDIAYRIIIRSLSKGVTHLMYPIRQRLTGAQYMHSNGNLDSDDSLYLR